MLISTLLNPMDVVKVRLQTQNQLGDAAIRSQRTAGHVHATVALPSQPAVAASAVLHALSAPSTPSSPLASSLYAGGKYSGISNGLLTIYREEGYGRGLMRGSLGHTAHSVERRTAQRSSLACSHLCCALCAV